MLDGDWLTSKDGKSRAKARAVIGCRPRSVGIKATANGETSVVFRNSKRAHRWLLGLGKSSFLVS